MNKIRDYLKELKSALAASDPATVQDALADAEAYLSDAVESIREKSPEVDEVAALQIAIDQYGSPQDTAAAYLEAEQRLMPSSWRDKSHTSKSIFGCFFAISLFCGKFSSQGNITFSYTFIYLFSLLLT